MAEKNLHKQVVPASSYTQINVPVGINGKTAAKKPGDTTYSNAGISLADTNDAAILDDLTQETLVLSNVIIEEQANTDIFVRTINTSITLTEPVPRSTNTISNQIKVFDDKSGMAFYIDHTASNETIHMRHTNGSYWSFTNENDYFRKIERDELSIVKRNKYNSVAGYGADLYKKGYTLNAYEDISINSQQDLSIMASGALGIKATGSSVLAFGTNLLTKSGGSITTRSKGPMLVESSQSIVLSAKESIVLKGKGITFDISNYDLEIKGSSTENILGLKEFSSKGFLVTTADFITLYSSDNIDLTATGGYSETIMGASISNPALSTSRAITVAKGNSEVNTLLGGQTLNVGLAGKMGSLEISILGKTTLTSLVQTTIDSTGQVVIGDSAKIISIGGATSTEPAVLGLKLMTWLNSHTHPHSHGPTATPLKPMLPTDLSKKIFLS